MFEFRITYFDSFVTCQLIHVSCQNFNIFSPKFNVSCEKCNESGQKSDYKKQVNFLSWINLLDYQWSNSTLDSGFK